MGCSPLPFFLEVPSHAVIEAKEVNSDIAWGMDVLRHYVYIPNLNNLCKAFISMKASNEKQTLGESKEPEPQTVIPCGHCLGWWYVDELPRHLPECPKKSD
jgi:hypothetical protein